MENNNLYKKLRFFALCLAIICMLLSLIKRAKAEEMPQNDKNYLHNLLSECLNYNEFSVYEDDIFSHFDNFIIYKNSNTEYVIDLKNGVSGYSYMKNCYCLDNPFINGMTSWFRYDLSYFSGRDCFVQDSNHFVSLFNKQYIVDFYIMVYDNTIGCRIAYSTSNSLSARTKEFYSYQGNASITKNLYRLSNSYYTTVFGNPKTSGYFVINNIESGINDSYCFSYDNQYYDYPKITNYPPNNNTDGFRVFKSTRSGRDYLIFDGLNAVPQNIKNGNWYLTDLISTLGFTVTTETDSYDFNYSFDIDDASDDFPYNSDYFKWQDNWGNLYLRWEIPIDELNLPDDSYGYTENVIMTISNNVSINNISVPYLGQFIYLTPVYLYGTQEESGLINPGNAAQPVIPDNPINQETRNKNYQSLVYGTLLNKSGLEFEEWKNNLQSGIIWYEILITQAPSLQDLINDFPNFSTSDIEKFMFGCNDKEEFENDMETDIEKNAFSQYIDYIVYIYNGSDAYHSSKFDYYIFETSKGREKAISFLLDTSNTYFDKQFDVLRNSIPYIKDSIDRIDTNLFNLGEDIFSQNNSIIANLISIDNKFNDLQDLLKDLFNKLFDRLNDLHLTQLDSIDNKLSTIISSIQTEIPFNEDDTIAESIAYYQSHTQTQAVLEDKYSVWFTGYCHFWLQEYGEEEPVRNNRSSNVNDFASSEKRHILFRTFKVITNIYDKMQEDLLFNRVEEMFDYFLDVSSDVSHTRRSYFYDVFNEQNTPTLDYNPYE